MDMQERDNLCMFLDGRGYPSELGKDQKRRLHEKASSFVFKDGELHHKRDQFNRPQAESL